MNGKHSKKVENSRELETPYKKKPQKKLGSTPQSY